MALLARYRCLQCRRVFPIRRTGDKREAGHVKHIWCVTCKKRTPHRQLGK